MAKIYCKCKNVFVIIYFAALFCFLLPDTFNDSEERMASLSLIVAFDIHE